MTKIIILRHGESESNVNRKNMMHPPTTPLTNKGKKQARKAAKFIKDTYNVKLIISSPHTRTRQTSIECKKYIKAKYDENSLFEEINGGDLQKIKKGELLRHPNGEKMQALIKKIDKLFVNTSMVQQIKNFPKIRSNEIQYFELAHGETTDKFDNRVKKSIKYLNSLKVSGDILIVSHSSYIDTFISLVSNIHLLQVDKMGRGNCNITVIDQGTSQFELIKYLEY